MIKVYGLDWTWLKPWQMYQLICIVHITSSFLCPWFYRFNFLCLKQCLFYVRSQQCDFVQRKKTWHYFCVCLLLLICWINTITSNHSCRKDQQPNHYLPRDWEIWSKHFWCLATHVDLSDLWLLFRTRKLLYKPVSSSYSSMEFWTRAPSSSSELKPPMA